jgi:hypothetical protein
MSGRGLRNDSFVAFLARHRWVDYGKWKGFDASQVPGEWQASQITHRQFDHKETVCCFQAPLAAFYDG